MNLAVITGSRADYGLLEWPLKLLREDPFFAVAEVRKHLQSPEPAWRHGRPVLQVKAEFRHKVSGVLHDRSASGATVFVEHDHFLISSIRELIGDLCCGFHVTYCGLWR